MSGSAISVPDRQVSGGGGGGVQKLDIFLGCHKCMVPYPVLPPELYL